MEICGNDPDEEQVLTIKDGEPVRVSLGELTSGGTSLLDNSETVSLFYEKAAEAQRALFLVGLKPPSGELDEMPADLDDEEKARWEHEKAERRAALEKEKERERRLVKPKLL